MPKASLGPWGKWYASTEDDTAHWTDRQFRVWSGIFGLAVRGRGDIPKIAPLRARYDPDSIDFLIAEGRLKVRRGGVVEVVGWSTYQAKSDPTAAARMARMRGRNRDDVTQHSDIENGLAAHSTHDRYAVTGTEHSISVSTSSSSPGERTDRAPAYDLDAWVAVSTVVDDLTGQSYSLRQPTSGLGSKALDLARAFGTDQAIAAIRRTSVGLEHPDASQLVLGANRLLRPIPNGHDVKVRSEGDDDRAARDRRLAATRRILDDAAEWTADVPEGVASSAAGEHDAPHRSGASRPVPQVRSHR